MASEIQQLPFESTLQPAMQMALEANFGSLERWRAEVIAMGKARGDGSGSVALAFQPRDGSLVNQWAADHAHAPAGGVPILVLAVDSGACVDAFMENIDWGPVYERYQRAVHAASEPFGAGPDELAGAVVLDVRRAGVYEAATTRLPGAGWRDPVAVTRWAGAIPAAADVVVYCVYGHEVGRATALRLRAQGLKARFLRGGLDGWQAAGRPVEPKGETP